MFGKRQFLVGICPHNEKILVICFINLQKKKIQYPRFLKRKCPDRSSLV